jgi:4-hydroxybenzoate polyprenyltransferase
MPESVTAPSWGSILKGHLALARLSNSPTVVSNVVTGAALAGMTTLHGSLGWLAGAMLCFYTAGMYLNDVCDETIDARERPDRPLPSGLISRTSALAVLIGLFVVGCGMLAVVGRTALISGLVLVALIVVYDLWHKTNPLSPILMALTRVMVYVTAFLSYSTQVTLALAAACGCMLLYVIGLTYIAKRETESVFTRYWPAVLLLLPAVYGIATSPLGAYLVLPVLFIGWTLYSVSRVYQGHIGQGIVRLIAGIALLDAMILATEHAAPGIGVALGAFALTLILQRYIKGT